MSEFHTEPIHVLISTNCVRSWGIALSYKQKMKPALAI